MVKQPLPDQRVARFTFLNFIRKMVDVCATTADTGMYAPCMEETLSCEKGGLNGGATVHMSRFPLSAVRESRHTTDDPGRLTGYDLLPYFDMYHAIP